MKKCRLFWIFILLFGLELQAQQIDNINRYIENPDMMAENQQPPHVPLVPYATTESAMTRNKQNSPWYQSLDGVWQFKWYKNPQQAPPHFMTPECKNISWDRINVPGVWQMQGYGYNMYRNIPQALFPYDPPNVPDDLNPTGCYRTTFTLSPDWDGRTIFLHFEGVKSASFVWVNGKYVGYDEGGMTPSEYDITPYLQKGENLLALQVIRWSDGSYLEDQDMWRFAGIHRSVYLFAAPDIHIRDFDIRSTLDDTYTDAELTVKADITAFKDPGKVSVTAMLYDQSGALVTESEKSVRVDPGQDQEVTLTKTIKAPLKWSAEKPNLYSLLLVLKKDGQTLEVVGGRTGFRKLEIRGNVALVNGVAIDFMGVNRHEHHPEFGRTMTEEMMRKDLELMKQFNVNAVRTCHYPNTALWYDLCDEYGIYVQDEVNAECHYAENWLANAPGVLPPFMDRFTRMVHRDKNHPSIVFWSTGNECGLGEVHYVMADWIKRFDPDRFLMHQGNWPNGWAPYVDINGPRYRSPYGFIEAYKEHGQPVVSGEYAHAMGNSLGHFDEFWEQFRKEPWLQGGFIWDWVDQGIYENLVLTQDRSSHDVLCALMGRPQVVPGPTGNALALSGLDDYIEVYRDPVLDITGNAVTLVADIYPRKWECSNPIITKGSSAYGLQQLEADSIEFYIHSEKRHAVKAYLPRDWKFNWHRIAGVYDGAEIKLIFDGKVLASKPCTGNIDNNLLPVYVGRNAELQQEQYPGWLSNSIFDNVGVFDRGLTLSELNDPAALSGESLLWLDFEKQTDKGRFLSYGSSPFCINGVIFSDRSVQPETWQMKKSHAPVQVKAVDILNGQVEIFNYLNFTNLEELDVKWALYEDEIILQSGSMNININPRSSKVVIIPYRKPELHAGAEYRLLLSFCTRQDQIWAPRGHEVTFDEFEIPYNVPAAEPVPLTRALQYQQSDSTLKITGPGIIYTFDMKKGAFSSLLADSTELLQAGPMLNAYRAPILNEWSPWGEREMDAWYRVGLDKQTQRTTSFMVKKPDAQHVIITVNTLTSAPGHQEGFESVMVYTVMSSGEITLDHHIKPVGDFYNMAWLPRIGLQFAMPGQFDHLTWYGRGPIETYPDRKTGAKTGIYSGSVLDQYVPYMVPQDHGNKTDVRWAALTNANGVGLLMVAQPQMNLEVTPYDNIDRALYAFQLHDSGNVIINLDHQVTGVGGTPVGTRPAYRVYPREYHYRLLFSPVNTSNKSIKDTITGLTK